MAVVSYTKTQRFNRKNIVWSAMANNPDTGSPFYLDDDALAAAVQIDGSFGGGTAVMQGSVDGTTWFTLKDITGTDISTTANALFEVSSSVMYIRPSLSGGTAGSVAFRVVQRVQVRM